MHWNVLSYRRCDTIYISMSTVITRAVFFVSLAIAIVFFYIFITPKPVAATGMDADAMCNPVILQCGCGRVPGPHGCTGGANMWQCPCGDTTNGFSTKGICVAQNKCLALQTSGQNGGMEGMQQALQQALQMLQQLMQGGGGGGGGGSPSGGGGFGAGGTGGPGGCTNYYNVTTPSSDPCAVYIPPVSGILDSTTSSGSSAADDLISSLLSGSYGNSNQNPNPGAGSGNSNAQNASTSGSGTVQSSGTTQYVVATTTTYVPTPAVPGVSGDIQYSSDKVTVLVNNVDQKNGTQVAGFYGMDANGQPTSVIASMCQARPWATNFLSFIIPGTFFDSLCQLRGYRVGMPAAATPVVSHPKTQIVTHTQATAATSTAATSTGPYVPPQADIWAVPASVPLGSRTTVFWSAKGVVSCTETSPDGSFSQSTLSGAAATVPLAGPTTYTISCITPTDDHVTNYVTVNLSAN